MKNIILILIFLVIFDDCYSQIETDNKSEYERVVVEFGQIIPIGQLKTKFDSSINVGFWFRTRLSRNKFVDFGGNVYFPKNRNSINYEHKDSIYRLKLTKLSGLVGARYSKLFEVYKNINFEWNSTLGLAVLGRQAIDKEEYNKNTQKNERTKKDGDYDQALCALALAQGFKLSRKDFGISCQFQYAPYSIFYKKIDSNFGSSSLIIGLVYKQ